MGARDATRPVHLAGRRLLPVAAAQERVLALPAPGTAAQASDTFHRGLTEAHTHLVVVPVAEPLHFGPIPRLRA